MRISDWSSDVCSSDLEATVSVTCSALSGQAATCTRLTRRRSVRMTPGSSAPRWTTRAPLWPRSGDMASSKLTDSLGGEEVGRHHPDGDVDVLQGVGGEQVLADAVGGVLHQAGGGLVRRGRAGGGRG